ncbi:MAG: SDR family NAD(P)-dependent oxidoreductase [Limisphaerales bacterium]
MLITGGAGFIGVNTARRFLQEGWDVFVWDNLSRCGAESNLQWLHSSGPVHFSRTDVREEKAVTENFRRERYDLVVHCAGQVAVSSSLTSPRHDLENNLLGTFNLLEAVRLFSPEALFIFASTNKVYGSLKGIPIVERDGRYQWADLPGGISEEQPLDFFSPYACSKGAADQYVRDYARIYGLATVCFRQSCIYGYRQFGMEDQGWVAWFLIAQALRRPITIFGDGKQTRDLLFIDDLVEAYCRAWQKRDKVAGQVYNIGGGPQNQFSIMQLIRWIETESAAPVEVNFAAPRRGDQKVFVADISKALADFAWRPSCSVNQGLRKLHRWVNANLELFREIGATPSAPESAPALESMPLEVALAAADPTPQARTERPTV